MAAVSDVDMRKSMRIACPTWRKNMKEVLFLILSTSFIGYHCGWATNCQKVAFKVPEVLDVSMIEFVPLGYYMEVLTDTNKRRKKLWMATNFRTIKLVWNSPFEKHWNLHDSIHHKQASNVFMKRYVSRMNRCLWRNMGKEARGRVSEREENGKRGSWRGIIHFNPDPGKR